MRLLTKINPSSPKKPPQKPQSNKPKTIKSKEQACLLPKSLRCAQQGDRMPSGHSPNFCFIPGRCTEQRGFGGRAQEGLVHTSSWIKTLPCNRTLRPHQETKHCSRRGGLGVEALLWLRQKKGFPPPKSKTSQTVSLAIV